VQGRYARNNIHAIAQADANSRSMQGCRIFGKNAGAQTTMDPHGSIVV
jgi:hypothetical protein